MTRSDKRNPSGSDDQFFEDAFAAIREATPTPSPDLMARVLADAAAVQAAGRKPGLRDWVRKRLDELASVLGGWQGAGALAASALLGVWIGYSGIGATTLWTGDLQLEAADEDPFAAFLLEG